jgi:hypothetical protein
MLRETAGIGLRALFPTQGSLAAYPHNCSCEDKLHGTPGWETGLLALSQLSLSTSAQILPRSPLYHGCSSPLIYLYYAEAAITIHLVYLHMFIAVVRKLMIFLILVEPHWLRTVLKKYWMIYRVPDFLAVVSLGSSPVSFKPLFINVSVSPIELTDGGGGGGGGGQRKDKTVQTRD